MHINTPQDVINSVHRLARRNPRGLDIQDRDWSPFLEDEDESDNDTDNSTYAPFNKENSEKGDESDDNNDDTDTNINPPPDQEMEQGPAGVTRHTTGGP